MKKGVMLPHIGTAIAHRDEVKKMIQLVADTQDRFPGRGIEIIEEVDTITRPFCHLPWLPVKKTGQPWQWKYDLSKPNPEYFENQLLLNEQARYYGLTRQHDVLTYPTLKHTGKYPDLSNNINGAKVDKNSFTARGMASNPGLREAIENLLRWMFPIYNAKGSKQIMFVLEGIDPKLEIGMVKFLQQEFGKHALEGIQIISNCYKGPGVLWSHHGGRERGQKSRAPSDDGEYKMTPEDYVWWVQTARRRRCLMVFAWFNGWPSGYRRFVNGKPVGPKLKYKDRVWIGLDDWYGILGRSFMAFARA